MNALLVDIGNSRIKWRFDDTRSPRSPDADHEAVDVDALELLAIAWRSRSDQSISAIHVSAVASVTLEAEVERLATSLWPAARVDRIVSTGERGGVVNGYRQPSQLGPDRWLAAIGAHALLPGRSLLVCCFGTATTIDQVRPDAAGARFVGGMILPGLEAMRRALIGGTARLPDGRGRVVDFADNTDDAIESGLAAAQAGAVERAWRAAKLSSESSCCVLAGGAAMSIAPALSGMPLRIVPDLVLHGLAVIAREEAASARVA